MSAAAIALSSLAALFWGAGALFDKLAVSNLSPTTAFFARFYLLFLVVFPFLVRGWPDHKAALLGSPRAVPLYLLASVVFYAAGMFVFYHALSKAEASKVVPFSSAYPLVTFLLALAFLSEPFTWPKLGGTALVVAGLAVLSK